MFQRHVSMTARKAGFRADAHAPYSLRCAAENSRSTGTVTPVATEDSTRTGRPASSRGPGLPGKRSPPTAPSAGDRGDRLVGDVAVVIVVEVNMGR